MGSTSYHHVTLLTMQAARPDILVKSLRHISVILSEVSVGDVQVWFLIILSNR